MKSLAFLLLGLISLSVVAASPASIANSTKFVKDNGKCEAGEKGCEPPPPECDPHNCQLIGICQSYDECVEGHFVKHHCNGDGVLGDLFWNPDASSVHGGTCDYFQNLSPAVQDQYRQDEICIPPCDWYQKPEDDCSPRYSYRVPFNNQTTAGRDQDLSCPEPPANAEPLYWNQGELKCDKKSRVNDKDGNPCP